LPIFPGFIIIKNEMKLNSFYRLKQSPLKMDIPYAFSEIIKLMWGQPRKEYLIIYHPEGIHLYKTNTFTNLLRILNTPGNSQQLYCQPVVIFACLGGESGAIEYEGTGTLQVKKITLNDYQDYAIKDGQIQIKIKLPEVITPETISTFKFESIGLKRPPQLRRIIREYYELIGKPFDEGRLHQRLENLMTDNKEYLFEDADELILRLNPKGTYFQELPKELNEIIIEYLNEFNYIKADELYKKNNPVLNLMEEITDTVLKENTSMENLSLFDILSKMRDDGSQLKVNELLKNSQDTNFLQTMMSEVGLKNIMDTINNKINN